MGERVKRHYDSSRRKAQAQATRRSVVEAAGRLFHAQGYTATTIQAIADEAGVAVQTVYAAFGSKRELLRQLLESAITGDDDPTPITERDESLAVAREPDPLRRAQLDAALGSAIAQRVAPIYRVVREAAASDPEFAEVLGQIKERRRAEMVRAAALLAGPDQLQLAGEEAAATLYVLYSPDVADMLMGDLGWSPDRYETWLATMLHRALLRG